MPIAKFAFIQSRHEVEAGDAYTGSYQGGAYDVDAIKEQWMPENMLPKLYNRRRDA